MYTVYVLRDRDGRFYKGLTSDLTRRLREHKSGSTITTSRMRELKVVYSEKYKTFEEAHAREKYLKTSAGRRFLKKKI